MSKTTVKKRLLSTAIIAAAAMGPAIAAPGTAMAIETPPGKQSFDFSNGYVLPPNGDVTNVPYSFVCEAGTKYSITLLIPHFNVPVTHSVSGDCSGEVQRGHMKYSFGEPGSVAGKMILNGVSLDKNIQIRQ